MRWGRGSHRNSCHGRPFCGVLPVACSVEDGDSPAVGDGWSVLNTGTASSSARAPRGPRPLADFRCKCWRIARARISRNCSRAVSVVIETPSIRTQFREALTSHSEFPDRVYLTTNPSMMVGVSSRCHQPADHLIPDPKRLIPSHLEPLS